MSTEELAQEANKTKVMNHKKAFGFSIISALAFGASNYITAKLSVDIGIKWMYATFITFIGLQWIFHIVKYF